LAIANTQYRSTRRIGVVRATSSSMKLSQQEKTLLLLLISEELKRIALGNTTLTPARKAEAATLVKLATKILKEAQ
jgi:hypothetical protein